jgi:glycosyltransferase involved in cell wall biosynthesis
MNDRSAPDAAVAPSLDRAECARFHILFLVRGLQVGGAERQLVALARGLHRAGHRVGVAVFYRGGGFEEDLRAEGIPIHDLAKRGRWSAAPAYARLVQLVRSERPDIIHAYMNLANLYSAALKPLFPTVKVVWGVRSALRDLSAYAYGLASRIAPGLERLASPLADAIVANSSSARRQAIASGLEGRKIVVIPNGIDCDLFRPDREGRAQMRAAWGIPSEATLVGMVARLDPVKGHPTLLRAFAAVARARPELRFVCVGDGERGYRERLERLASELGLVSRMAWVRDARATSAVYSALDVSVLSSDAGESFPNVVGEAMACGVPCVVSDSGDAAAIVGDTGVVVPPRDPAALSAGILNILDRLERSRAALSSGARDRIERNYSIEQLVTRTARALESLNGGG